MAAGTTHQVGEARVIETTREKEQREHQEWIKAMGDLRRLVAERLDAMPNHMIRLAMMASLKDIVEDRYWEAMVGARKEYRPWSDIEEFFEKRISTKDRRAIDEEAHGG